MFANTGKPKAKHNRRVTFPSGVVFLATVQSGDIDETLQLLQKGVDPNSCSADGLTAHHQCCIDGNLEMLRVLVEHGADVNAQDNEGWTPLHAAGSCDQSEICSFLLEHGADPTALNSDGQIPQDLCEEDDNECLALLKNALCDRNVDVEHVRDSERHLMLQDAKSIRDGLTPIPTESLKFGATILHVAVCKGYDDVVEVLLEAGMDVNAKDDDGWTPLHAAAHWKYDRACTLLADYDADFKALSKQGQSCFDVADPEIADKLNELQEAQSKRPARPKKEPKPSPVVEKLEKASPTLSTRRVSPPEINAVTTAQTTPPSSTDTALSDRRRSAETVDPATNEPEAKRRQKARRSRETRRLTQHVRLEDLQAATNGCPSPDVASDDDSHRDMSASVSETNIASEPGSAPEAISTESISVSDSPVVEKTPTTTTPAKGTSSGRAISVKDPNRDLKKRRPTRRPRGERRQTGAVLPNDLSGMELSASEGEADAGEMYGNEVNTDDSAQDTPEGRRRTVSILAQETAEERQATSCL